MASSVLPVLPSLTPLPSPHVCPGACNGLGQPGPALVLDPSPSSAAPPNLHPLGLPHSLLFAMLQRTVGTTSLSTSASKPHSLGPPPPGRDGSLGEPEQDLA